ncbi:histone-binding protein N1/N2-like isoform X1 [Strongylocentrotus purpuratus]|uniref:Tetratricopeptide SHNi-TPR domain-containing protein n=1 Tax=Strongylocentrotus purpuratus TaxID=7668 RepID=A0A7M7T403_STRPU|nr:histone-binding protein N1/N2-like isoform X1 [Strongylocentrotus purpuratus]
MFGTEEDKPGSSSAADMADLEEDSGPEEDVDAEALELMGQGKRNLVVGDPPAAVQCFQEACELLASKYGETAEECGDAYYQYGCSLLELASMENGVLGNALQGVPDESADSADSDDEEGEQKPSGSNVESADKLEAKEREEVAQQVKDALEANCESEESEKEDKGKDGEGGEDEEEDEKEDEKMEEGGDNKDAEAAKKGEDEKKDVKKEEIKEEEKKDEEKVVEEKDAKKEKEKSNEKEADKKDTEKVDKDDTVKTDKKEEEGKTEKKDDDDDDDDEAGPSAEGDQKEDGDDISNFQLAWEMLELSRVIISKKEDEESQMKVSQIHLKLGELGLETEQYTQSIVDFKACLEIQKKYLDPESRLIAGTHYNLGLACTFDQKFDESIEHYRESKQLIEKRLASLEKKVSETEGKGKEKADEKDPIVCAQKEIDDLTDLLPDIVSKLEDAKEMKLQAVPSDGAGPSSSLSSSAFAPSSSSGFDSPSSAFAPSSSTEPIQQIAVKKADGAQVLDISHLVRKKRKPEESDAAAADSKRSRQEENGEKPAVNGSGDSKVVNGNGHMANGVMNGDTNGDSKHSPEKPSEIKTKKLVSDGAAPAAMETA